MSAPAPLINKGKWPPGNSFVLPDHKMVYISVTKVACTSLRWMVADLVGEDPQRFYRAVGDHQTRLMTIHAQRAIWKHSPQIKHLPPKLLGEISRDNGWLIFSTVRDPWSRLWSAWQSKFLVRHDTFVDNYSDEAWFPRVPSKPEEILEDWVTFVRARPWESHPLLSKDPHFKPQVDSVRPDAVNYSRVYDMSELSALFADIHRHLAGLGKDRELYLPRANESPAKMTTQTMDDGVADIIEKSYHRDFDVFGDRWSRDAVKLSTEPWSEDVLAAIAYHGVANQRIGDLSKQLKATRAKLADSEARGRAAETALQRAALRPGAAGDMSMGDRFRAAVIVPSRSRLRSVRRRLRER